MLHRLRGLVILAGLAIALVACEAQTTVQTRLVLPSPLVASEADRARLHVQVLSSHTFTRKLGLRECPPFDTARPGGDDRIVLEDGHFTLEQSRIPSVPEFCAAAWFDANGNTQVDPGDAVGNLAAPYPVQPSTFLGSNRYQSPPVELQLVK